jgi:hypothetical protein
MRHISIAERKSPEYNHGMEQRSCAWCKASFPIFPDDLTFYQKIGVPPPTLCPDCRYKRRLLDRNEWSLYRRKCDMTGESIVSIYREDAPFPVYKHDAWRSDSWDPLEYGRDFDFAKPFFEQYHALRQAVPHTALVSYNSVNSEYSNQSQDNKDCYMVSASGGSEKCMYGNWYQPGCFLSADCYMMQKGELCYECINCGRVHACAWCEDCFDSTNLYFSTDCRGCNDCFGCVGLRNKKYCWFNEQLSKEEYEQRIHEFGWTRKNIASAKEAMRKLFLRLPHKYYHGSKAYNSTGDYLENNERSRLAFNCRDTKDTGYLQDTWLSENCRDNTEIYETELSYEIQGCSAIRNSVVIRSCITMTDCYYCDMSQSCSNCFGCISLKSKEYCILNKQYSKEEYLSLKKRIIEHMRQTGEWGEYFPPEYSPFAYNESVAQDFFPLTKEEALQQGFPWYDAPTRDYKFTMKTADVPQAIKEIDDSILDQVIQCATQESDEEKRAHPACTTAFKLIPLELAFYRKLGIPVPAKCYPCRRIDRFAKRNPRKLWKRMCQCLSAEALAKADAGQGYKNTARHFHGVNPCPNQFETSYAPDRPEIIYCEACYNSEIA